MDTDSDTSSIEGAKLASFSDLKSDYHLFVNM